MPINVLHAHFGNQYLILLEYFVTNISSITVRGPGGREKVAQPYFSSSNSDSVTIHPATRAGTD